MGMTIDNHIEVLKSYHNGFTGYAGNLQESIAVAVDIMNKYQRIQEIMNELNGNFYGSYLKDRQVLEKIYEVLEDGENN